MTGDPDKDEKVQALADISARVVGLQEAIVEILELLDGVLGEEVVP